MINDFIQSFSDGGYAAFTTFGLSALSLIIAVCAWLSGNKANRHIIEIEKGRDQRTEKEAAKARLVAALVEDKCEFSPMGSYAPDHILLVTNEGNGQARNIKILLDEKELSPPTDASGNLIDKSTLDPMACFKQRCRYKSRVRIEWTDDSGENGLYESDL